ncbi:hypothetical protein [uncultured Sunxiuqinia sp.]|uniref:hypothetical protein n=1 Tax=uncultured Sunxiuqinia sp. TaxID=1573825 RepID=UPI00262879C4|nr:hypothetical protein [uncultured Sunxiuqinia sp.]
MPTISSNSLNTAAQKYRKELLIMAVLGLANTLQHMTLRTGVRYKETVGELTGPVELMPYTGLLENEGYEEDGMTVDGRDLETFLGQAVKLFDPNTLVSSLYGAAVTKGSGLENIEFNKAVLTLMMRKISGGLNKSIFNATRNAAGKTTGTLFNGLDTITTADITAAKIAVAKNNLYEFTEAITANNAVDNLKAVYRACSDELKSEMTKMVLPQALYDAYTDDYQQTVGATPYNREFKKTFLEGSDRRCELVPLVGKKAAPYLQITTKENMLVGVNQVGEEEKIEVRRGDNPFKLQFVTTMFFGTQFESISAERLMVGKFFAG